MSIISQRNHDKILNIKERESPRLSIGLASTSNMKGNGRTDFEGEVRTRLPPSPGAEACILV
jgi:hypothetical protein